MRLSLRPAPPFRLKVLDSRRNFGLGHSRLNPGEGVLVRLVREVDGLANGGDLLVVLPASQALNDRDRGYDLEALQLSRHPRPLLVRQMSWLKSEATNRRLAQRPKDTAEDVPRRDLNGALSKLLRRLFAVPSVHEQRRTVRCDDKAACAARKAGQVPDVDAIRDEEGVQPLRVQREAHADEPSGYRTRIPLFCFAHDAHLTST